MGASSLRLPWTTRRLRYPRRTKREVPDIPDSDIRDELTLSNIHNEKTGYYLRSPCMGLARDRPVGSDLQ